MAIVVEDGTIVSGANSYVSEAELTAFNTARNITLSGNYTEEQLLILAMDYVDSLKFKGAKRLYTQGLQWPRVDVWIDGYYNDIDNIPTELKNGLMQVAVSIDAGNSPQQLAPRKTVKEKVGELEVEYSAGSSSVVIDTKVMSFLYKLLDSGAGGANTKATKG
jgi:hypothetical protein